MCYYNNYLFSFLNYRFYILTNILCLSELFSICFIFYMYVLKFIVKYFSLNYVFSFSIYYKKYMFFLFLYIFLYSFLN